MTRSPGAPFGRSATPAGGTSSSPRAAGTGTPVGRTDAPADGTAPDATGRRGPLGLTLAALALCVPGLTAAWGFSVDDAWIVRRVALRGLSGHGYRFNPDMGTDAITPLGFAQLVGSVASLGSLDPLLAARSLGLLATVVALALAAHWAFGHLRQPRERVLGLLAWAVLAGPCLPLVAWAGAGLATGLVAFLLTAGFVLLSGCNGRSWPKMGTGAFLIGAAGAWRPELVPVGVAILFAHHRGAGARAGTTAQGSVLCQLAVFSLPSVVVMALRWATYGTPLPLASVAKAPELTLGLRYALGGAVLVGPLWLVWPHLLRRSVPAGEPRGGAAVLLVHALALSLAGGDWMAFFRLWVPVLPLALAWGVASIPRLPLPALWLPLGVGANAILQLTHGTAAREVIRQREELIARAAPALQGVRRIAAVDIGWLGAATDAVVVDMAGVTDPTVAALPGGHTSKHISPGFFAARDIDAWVVRATDRSYRLGAPPDTIHAAYVVDARLIRHLDDLDFVPTAMLPLGGSMGQYIILRHQP